MNLSPEILDAMRGQYDAMDFEFNPEGLSEFAVDGSDTSAAAMGLSPQEIARLLVEKITAAHIERELPNCVRRIGGGVLVSMPLDDLRSAHGYLALVEAGTPIGLDQTKRAIQIAIKLSATAADAA